MSSASIVVWSRTCASGAPAAARASNAGAVRIGWVSRIRRWRVQSPPFVTSDGTPGSGMIEPKAPPPPANLKAVT